MTKETNTIKKQAEITEEENLKVMKQCSRFQFCNAPKCPLDYFQDERVELKGEDKCKLPKSIRKKIGKGTALKYQGLTKKEWTGIKIWNDKSDEERREIIKRGKNNLQNYTRT